MELLDFESFHVKREKDFNNLQHKSLVTMKELEKMARKLEDHRRQADTGYIKQLAPKGNPFLLMVFFVDFCELGLGIGNSKGLIRLKFN